MSLAARALWSLLLLSAAAGVQASEGSNPDPWEGFNRRVFAFNDWFDRHLMQPLARGYQAVTPEQVDTRVTYFFRNLDDVTNAANFLLQGDPRQALDATCRVIGNTALGAGGLFDVASAGGLARRETTFGSTLGHWGIGAGNYLVLPFLGPSTVRDTVAIPVDWTFNPLPTPVTLVPDEAGRYGLEALLLTDKRADALRYEQAIVGDRYAFIRDIYLQHRDFEVNGAPQADPFLDDEEAVEPEAGGDAPPDATEAPAGGETGPVTP